MKWLGEFEINRFVFPNQILQPGLSMLGQLLTTGAGDYFNEIRILDSNEAPIATASAGVTHSVTANELVITSIADFASADVTVDIAFAELVLSGGQVAARAPVAAAAGQAIEITRRDTFTVNGA